MAEERGPTPSSGPPASPEATPEAAVSRRRFLRFGAVGAAGVVVAGAVGYGLVEHDVLPGRLRLNALLGACSLAQPRLDVGTLGPTRSGTFHSAARGRAVGYTVAWPPGHGPGSVLPLVVFLHGEGATHVNATSGVSPAELVALRVGGVPLRPVAIATVDGGTGYWHPHPGDDPMGMVTDELIPLCQRRGLGRPAQGVGIMGISMGGYGAIALAESHPRAFRAVAAISPAIWTSYDQANGANHVAYTDASEFAAYDAVTHAASLRGVPLRVASGADDPFRPGVLAFTRALAPGAEVVLGAGCHDGSFFRSQEPASIQFVASHL